MTTPIYFPGNKDSNLSPHEEPCEHLKFIKALILKTNAASRECIDNKGNRCRLWALPNNTVWGTVMHSNQQMSVLPSERIDIPCSTNPLQTLHKIKNLSSISLDLAYISETKRIVIFPKLRAAGLKDKVNELAYCALKPNLNYCNNPPFLETPSKLAHIFRDKQGHFSKDTPENRTYILAAVSNSANRKVINKFGVEIYFKVMPDGYQAWAHVRNGFIINGGRDIAWKKWQPPLSDNPKDAGRMVPIPVTIFKEQIQIDRLTNVFNTTIGENHWEPHPFETLTIARDVGGVRHETGIIVDLLEDLKSSQYNDYLFFIPQNQGTKSLDKQEILQIIQEIAKGIYLHDTIPFFSLNMNLQEQNYSIIHPCYQNTYVGHIISMLDYYLKGFWTGQLFDQSFIQEWSKNPTIDDDILQQHLVSMKELCQLHEEIPFHSFDQILQNLIEENSLTPEQLAILVKETQNLVLSCKIIGKQNSILKHQNLFVLDGEVQLIHSIEGTPEGPDQLLCHRILDQACTRICQQIQDIGFKIPIMQKWLRALQIMNFFSTYFRTLQQAEKIPVFADPIQADSQKICPSIFPPIPHPTGPQIEIHPKTILNSLTSSQKQLLQEYCQKNAEDSALKETLRPILISAGKRFFLESSSENIQHCIDATLTALRSGYRSIDEQIQKLLIDLKITSGSYHSIYRFLLNLNIHLVAGNINRQVSALKNTIDSKKIYNEDSEQLELLLQIQKALQQASQWVNDPLSTLVEKENWNYDIRQKKLVAAQKTSSGDPLKIYGGYEPHLSNIISQESALAKNILQQNRKKLDTLEYERIVPIDSNDEASTPSGILLKLPLEDSFPLFSHGLPYKAIQLFSSSIKDTNDHTFYTLLQSIRAQDQETFNTLYTKEIDFNRLDLYGRAAIHYASTSPSTYFLQELIHKKVDLLTPDSQGWTALHHAANIGNMPAIELLLAAAPQNLNTIAKNGETPIYLAVHNNHLPVVEKFIQSNADLNLKPTHGYNLLLSAIHNGHEELALLLVQSGKIDLNYSWRNGKNALHFAIEMKMEKLLENLLRKGVDRNHPYLGEKPIVIAQEQGWQRGVEILNINFAYQEPTCTIL